MKLRNIEIDEDILYGDHVEIGITGKANGITSTHYAELSYAEVEAVIATLDLLLKKIDNIMVSREQRL